MERLEAAMAKARAARRKVPTDAQIDGLGIPGAGVSVLSAEKPGVAETAADWAALRSIDIPPQLARRNRLNALLGPQFSAPYDMLRARVLRQMKEAGWTRLVVTSPDKKCGKSTISLNLALSLARQPELKVILMDFDLRRPSLADLLRQPVRTDLAGLLQPGARFADYAVRYGTNLAICTNRSPVRNSAELLQSTTTQEILDRIEVAWKPDVIIFDSPPMQGNDDNLGFLTRVDCALLVAAAGSSTISQIDVCEQELTGLTNVIGTVLNKCRYLDTDSGYNQSYY